MCPLPIFLSTYYFPSLQAFSCFLDLVALLLLFFLFVHFSSWTWHTFQFKIPFFYPSCIFLLLVLGFPVIFHFSKISWHHPYTQIFFYNFFAPVHYSSIKFSGIIVVSRVSLPERCHFGFSPLLDIILQLLIPFSSSIAFVTKFMTLSGILDISRRSIIQLCEIVWRAFL